MLLDPEMGALPAFLGGFDLSGGGRSTPGRFLPLSGHPVASGGPVDKWITLWKLDSGPIR
jgi:hypothetical protein